MGGNQAFYIDGDGDGYGVGMDYVTGPDADDSDPQINTLESIMTKYPSIKSFLVHKGYISKRLIFISPEGDDEKGRVDDMNKPFAGLPKILGLVLPGDTIVFRKGVYRDAVTLKNFSGTKAEPITLMACPGETVIFENCGTGGNSAGISLKGGGFINFDGFVFDNTVTPKDGNGIYLNGTTQYDWDKVHDITIRNIESKNTKSGVRAMVNIHHLRVETCVLHDTGSHNIYIGTSDNDQPNSNIAIHKNILYKGGQTYEGLFGIQHNGIVDGLVVEKNICHSNSTGGGISLLNGAVNSMVRHNLIFNNARNGVVLYAYQAKWGWHFSNNQIIQNTIRVGDNSTLGNEETKNASGILLNDGSGVFNISGTVIQDNIITAENGYPVDIYQEAAAETTIIEKNRLYREMDKKVIKIGENAFKIKEIEKTHRLIRKNLFTKPEYKDDILKNGKNGKNGKKDS
jgi:hypothetical protein